MLPLRPAHPRKRTAPARRSAPGVLALLVACAVAVSPCAAAPASADIGQVEALTTSADGIWTARESGVTLNLDDVFFIDESIGWVSGENGALLKTTDGGATWAAMNAGTTVTLAGLHFIDENTGWVVGDSGVIRKTTDGGQTWTAQVSNTTKNLWNVQFIDENVGFAQGIAGGYGPPPPGEYSPVLRTVDGGQTWIADESHEMHFNSIFFVDADTGWASGNGYLAKTTDGAETWLDILPDSPGSDALYWSIHFIDADTGWLVGLDYGAGGLIMKTTDGGANWTRQDPSRDVELIDVFFTDAQTGWVSGNNGVILHTADGGDTWTTEASGGSRYVRRLHFTDADAGWAVGHAGWLYSYGPLPPVMPIEGSDRFATAVSASKSAYPTGADTVVIATGMNWPDALGGAALAGALGGPILLVGYDALPSAVSAEIDRLGADSAVIVGGPNAVSTGVETALEGLFDDADKVTRIKGDDRYKTADAVAAAVVEAGGGAAFDGAALVATGGDFPDALAAAPLAAAQGWPLVLANPRTGLSAASKAVISDAGDVYILGGEAAVSAAVESDLKKSFTVDRLDGTDRYATAAVISAFAVDEAGHTWDRVGITTGLNFPDALAGGVLQGRAGSVMLLTRPDLLSPATATRLSSNKAEIETVTFFGGANAVSPAVRVSVDQMLQ